MAACSKKRPWHDWQLHMWTLALYTKIVSQTIKPYCIKNRTTKLVGAYFHFLGVIRLILGEATKLPLRLLEWLLEHAVPIARLCMPIDFYELKFKTCDGYQKWQLSPNFLWIRFHQKKNTPCCQPASRAVWVVAVCDHDGFPCKVGSSWLRLWPNQRQVSNYTNGEWRWLEHLGTL